MFVLVIMSIGIRGEFVLDYEMQPVDLVKVKDLLSPGNFPAMKGKPKLMIIQACSGGKVEDARIHWILKLGAENKSRIYYQL